MTIQPTIRRPALLAMAAVALLAAGCATDKPKEYVQVCKFPDNPKEQAPEWVCGRQIPDGLAVSGLGSHPKTAAGYAFQLSQAQAAARVNMSFTLRANVQAMIDQYAATTGAGSTETADIVNKTVSRQTTEGLLQGSKLATTAVSERGDLYVLLGMTKDQRDQAVASTLKTSMNSAPATYQKLEAAKAQKEMAAALGGGDGTRAPRSQDAVISDIMKVGS